MARGSRLKNLADKAIPDRCDISELDGEFARALGVENPEGELLMAIKHASVVVTTTVDCQFMEDAQGTKNASRLFPTSFDTVKSDKVNEKAHLEAFLFVGRQKDSGTERQQHRTTFHRHGLRHDQDAPVIPFAHDEVQRKARAPAGRIDHYRVGDAPPLTEMHGPHDSNLPQYLPPDAAPSSNEDKN